MRLPMMMTPSTAMSTVIVGLNAALQKRFVLSPENNPNLVPGRVHRASAVQTGVGGKGQDVFVTLRCLRYYGSGNSKDDDDVQLAQFLGRGPEGDQVRQLLSEMVTMNDQDDVIAAAADDTAADSASIMPLTVRTVAPLRTCTSVVGRDTTTELVEPSGQILEHEWDELLDRIRNNPHNQQQQQQSRHCTTAAVAFMGSLPPGCPETAYAQIYEALALATTRTSANQNEPSTTEDDDDASTKMLCVIDSVAGLPALLQSIAADSKKKSNAILKINASELCRLVSVAVDNGADGTADGVPVEKIAEAVSKYCHIHAAATAALAAVALTDGAHPAHLAVFGDSANSGKNDDGGDEDGGTAAAAAAATAFDLYQLQVPDLKAYYHNSHNNKKKKTNDDNDNDEDAALTLYPIGAGDAVAAGTLAAWRSLRQSFSSVGGSSNDDNDIDNNKSKMNQNCLPEETARVLQQAAVASKKTTGSDAATTAMTTTSTTQILTTAFQFGLAVGSASCLQEENSVVDPADCRALFQQQAAAAAAATLVARHALSPETPAATTAAAAASS